MPSASTPSHSTRPAVIGPALAGLLIVWIGVAGAFYFNAVATLAVVVAVMLMRPSPPSRDASRADAAARCATASSSSPRHPALRWIVLAQLVTALLTRPYSQLIPALAVNVLHAGARGLRLGGFRNRRRRIRRRARHRVLRAARAAFEALACWRALLMSCGVLRAGLRADARSSRYPCFSPSASGRWRRWARRIR